jgi:hypothetical protein
LTSLGRRKGVHNLKERKKKCAVLLGVDGGKGAQFVVEGVPIPVHLALALFVLYFLALFIAFVAADSWSKGHVSHECLVDDAKVGPIGQLNRYAFRICVAGRR